MAGFGTGLVHGTLLCGATLAALSLAVPRESAPVAAPVADVAAVARPDRADRSVDSLPPPVGSEFARGNDMQPATPALLQGSSQRPPSDAPAAPRPTTESAPALTTLSAARPADPASPTVPTAPQNVAVAPDLPKVPTAEAPIPVSPPGQVQTPGLDRRPELTAQSGPEDAQALPTAPGDADQPLATGRAAALPPPLPDAAPAQPVAQPQTAPALPAPALDLSTPPDLGDLRILERN